MSENFVRDGKIGDEVWHPCLGNGVINDMGRDDVWIHFKGNYVHFDKSGKWYHADGYAALCWGHRIVQQLNQGKPPVRG